ncbi:MAG: tRNA pseudouridine(38-40) synthase TruA [Tannerella sp.]|nr:tRNA pseudouridine(38-40) synthase TruA [Tannerella sp.]
MCLRICQNFYCIFALLKKGERAVNRYFIYLAYNGTRHCGWQNQPNGMSVQQRLEETLSKVLRQDISIVGAGRTDAGVHARMMVAHFDVTEALENTALLVGKLNNMLSKDIAVYKIVPVREDAHARFGALSRTYEYLLSDQKKPFNYEYIYRTPLRNMDFKAMNEACAVLFDYADFTSFSKLHTDVKTNYCHIREAGWKKVGDIWVFTIKADRFLRNMVRAIVGTLFDVGRSKISIDDFRKIIEAKDRRIAGMSVPPEGLALTDIEYPNDIFLES